jgi:hypothetical protein
MALLFVALTAANGCAKNENAKANNAASEASPQASNQQMMPGMMGMGDACPMAVPGTTVQTTNTSDGMTMTFTTTGGVAELRKRVHAMADHMDVQSGGMGMHGMMMGNADGGAMMGGGGMMGGNGMMGGGGMMDRSDGGAAMMMGGMMPPVHAQAEDVERGAMIRMTPVSPSNLDAMRQQMQQHVQMMNQAHGCPMMGSARVNFRKVTPPPGQSSND